MAVVLRASIPAMSQAAASSPELCPRCGGRGWLVAPDGGAGTARRCDCQKRELSTRMLDAAGIPRRYLRCRLEGFNTHQGASGGSGGKTQLVQALTESRRYVEGFLRADGSFTHTGLLYIGPPGVGKTHLAVAVLVELITTYHLAGRFVDFTSLIHQIQNSFDPNSPESKREILDPVMRAPLLVLDELGAQKPTPWVQDILYLIINGRYNERLPTLFTTNYALDEAEAPARGRRPRNENLDRGADPPEGPMPLVRRVEARLVSRLFEMARPVRLGAVEDFRREVQMQHLRA